MSKQPIIAMQPMLQALRIEQTVSLDDCLALIGELFEATRCSPGPFELSGNEYFALINLAIARHKAPTEGSK